MVLRSSDSYVYMLVLGMGAGTLFAAGAVPVSGDVLDPAGRAVAGAVVHVGASSVRSDQRGHYEILVPAPATCTLTAEAPGFAPAEATIEVAAGRPLHLDLRFAGLASQKATIEVVGHTTAPDLDLRNAEVFNRTLFTRDDQVFEQLDAGINAGQHEGGGKSLEIRRFGFNLDHGGVNGGLKILVDDVQQNQGTQGHGQGYLGSLKALSPELIQSVTILNGPFSAEYGDFSGLGVVHIKQRESLPDEFTVRLEGGQFSTRRGFFAYSPSAPGVDAYVAYEGSYTNGPFANPGRYRRDNLNANYTSRIGENQRLGFRAVIAGNRFDSSGQLPLDLVSAGALDRFGYIDPTDGGRVHMATFSSYYSRALTDGDTFHADASVSRSLFDLYSNFTFFLTDPIHGDAFQQHDSRLAQGGNAQYTHSYLRPGVTSLTVAGTNFLDSEINVGLYPREGRVPLGVATRADAHVANAAGYVQENLGFLHGRLTVGAGLRYDEFRYSVRDLVMPDQSGTRWAGRWQGKGSLAFIPSRRLPLTIYANYGRGINSIDARGVVQHPTRPHIAATDFYQFGTSSSAGRISLTTDVFLIDHSNEMVYVPDDGSFEFRGPSRAYGYETKLSVSLTRRLSLNGGVTKIGNSFFRGGDHRVYVDSAPHFVASAALTLAGWRGWSGSLRIRAINHYRLDGADPSVVATGLTVFDLGISRPIRRGVELNLSFDNLANRAYYETQNYFESRVTPDAPAVWRIHGTPGYPLTAMAGVTLHLGRAKDR